MVHSYIDNEALELSNGKKLSCGPRESDFMEVNGLGRHRDSFERNKRNDCDDTNIFSTAAPFWGGVDRSKAAASVQVWFQGLILLVRKSLLLIASCTAKKSSFDFHSTWRTVFEPNAYSTREVDSAAEKGCGTG